MADVQLEHGYTKIANELLEVLARTPLNGTQWRILLAVFRYTYGFNRKEAELSEGYIAKVTGIHRKQISRELNVLIEKKLLLVKREATFNSSRVLAFNKNYDSWVVSTKTLTGNKNTPANESVGSTGSGLVDTTGSGLVTQEINNTNKKINKMSIDDFFEKIWSLYPRKRGKGKISKTQKEKLYKIGIDELTRAINRYKQEVAGKDEQYIMYGSTFFNRGYLDFLDANYQDKTETRPNAEYLRLKEMVNGGQGAGI